MENASQSSHPTGLNIKEDYQREMKSFADVYHTNRLGDFEVIGQVTKSHLVIEHFLIEHLKTFNPNLTLDGANLDFAKLLKLADGINHQANFLSAVTKPLWALNTIRRDLVHRLGTNLESHPEFPKIRGCVEKITPNTKKEDLQKPLFVIDLFTVLSVTFIKISKILKEKYDEIELQKVRHEAIEKILGPITPS